MIAGLTGASKKVRRMMHIERTHHSLHGRYEPDVDLGSCDRCDGKGCSGCEKIFTVVEVDDSGQTMDRILYQGNNQYAAEMYRDKGFVPSNDIQTQYYKVNINEYDNSCDVDSPSLLMRIMSCIFTNYQLAAFKMIVDKELNKVNRMTFNDDNVIHCVVDIFKVESMYGEVLFEFRYEPLGNNVITDKSPAYYESVGYGINMKLFYPVLVKDDKLAKEVMCEFRVIGDDTKNQLLNLSKFRDALFACHHIITPRCSDGAKVNGMREIMASENVIAIMPNDFRREKIVYDTEEIKL